MGTDVTRLVVAGVVVSVVIVGLWIGRTAWAEHRTGRGQAQLVRRDRLVRVLDLALWVLGVAWGTLLAVYFTLSLTGA